MAQNRLEDLFASPFLLVHSRQAVGDRRTPRFTAPGQSDGLSDLMMRPWFLIGIDLSAADHLASAREHNTLPMTSRDFPSLVSSRAGPAPVRTRFDCLRHGGQPPASRINRGVVRPNLPTVSVPSRYEVLGTVRTKLCMSLSFAAFKPGPQDRDRECQRVPVAAGGSSAPA